VSLRGGTTKQSVKFSRIFYVKFIRVRSFLLAEGIGSNLADCFVVPPRNDTLIWCFGDVDNGQSLKLDASYYTANKTKIAS
jgi:hypothetical protein